MKAKGKRQMLKRQRFKGCFYFETPPTFDFCLLPFAFCFLVHSIFRHQQRVFVWLRVSVRSFSLERKSGFKRYRACAGGIAATNFQSHHTAAFSARALQ